MAIKSPLAEWELGLRDVTADLSDDGGAEGYVGDEVAIHYVDVQPVSATGYGAGAFVAEVCEVGGEN